MTDLSPAEVNETFMACLADRAEGDDVVVVEGIIHTVAMSRVALDEHREKIETMAYSLPVPFFERTGGGWSFLNLCKDRDGHQWTGLHPIMEQLCSLLIGLGVAERLLPREVWPALPGSVPYFIIHDERLGEPV